MWWPSEILPDGPPATLSFPFLNSRGEENKMEKPMGPDYDREITYQLLSWAKQT